MTHLLDDIHEKQTSARDLVGLFLGRMIGQGMSRDVYAHEREPGLVIKYEGRAGFQNANEWNIWKSVEHEPEVSKWFAPCVEISANGLFLIQKRVEPMPRAQFPESIPSFFVDTKYRNFGLFEGRLVCSDYGTLVPLAGLSAKRMKKAQWWDEARV